MPIGPHQYEVSRADLSDQGEISLALGQRRDIKLRLTQGGAEHPFTIAAQLKCLRGGAEEAQPKRCAQSLQTGDLFTIELISDRDLFIYLFGLNNQELVLLYPKSDARAAGAIPGGVTLIFPQKNAWVIDHQKSEDELWLLATQAPLDTAQVGERGAASLTSLTKKVAQSSELKGDQDLLNIKSSKGPVFLRWVLRSRLPK